MKNVEWDDSPWKELQKYRQGVDIGFVIGFVGGSLLWLLYVNYHGCF